MNKEKLKKLILRWIYENYGIQEMEEPCYDIDDLCEYLVNEKGVCVYE